MLLRTLRVNAHFLRPQAYRVSGMRSSIRAPGERHAEQHRPGNSQVAGSAADGGRFSCAPASSSLRFFSSLHDDDRKPSNDLKNRLQRFVKQYGVVGIGTHTCLCFVWFGGVYTGISCGVDMQELSSTIGVTVDIQDQAANVGNFVTSWLLYKAIQPVRMAVTVAVTPFVAKQLRDQGIYTGNTEGEEEDKDKAPTRIDRLIEFEKTREKQQMNSMRHTIEELRGQFQKAISMSSSTAGKIPFDNAKAALRTQKQIRERKRERKPDSPFLAAAIIENTLVRTRILNDTCTRLLSNFTVWCVHNLV